jgi:phage repressor protein C with HTH and peptisase S24 domain
VSRENSILPLQKVVERILKEKGLQKKDFAEKMGVIPQRVSQYLKGNPTQATLKRIADALGVTVSRLMEEDGVQVPVPVTPYEIPLYGSITAGSGEAGLVGEVVGSINVTEEERKAGVFAVRVSGDSMSPEIKDGDIALFEPMNGNPPKAGQVCAVQVSGWKSWAIKEVSQDPRGWVILRSLNPGFPPIEVNPEEDAVTIKGKLYRTVRNWRKVVEDEGAPYRVKKK